MLLTVTSINSLNPAIFITAKLLLFFLPLSLTAVAAGIYEQKQEYFKS